jgi:hypothetical protein
MRPLLARRCAGTVRSGAGRGRGCSEVASPPWASRRAKPGSGGDPHRSKKILRWESQPPSRCAGIIHAVRTAITCLKRIARGPNVTQELQSARWDLNGRLSEWGAAHPFWRKFGGRAFGQPRHRTYVMPLYGTEEPDGLSRGPSISGGTHPWYLAVCQRCRWESRHAEEGAALTAAVEHSPYVRPLVLSETHPRYF